MADSKQSGTYADLQRQIDNLTSALLNRITYKQFNEAIDISIGQFGNNTELVTDKRMKEQEKRLTIALEAVNTLTNELNLLKAETKTYTHIQAVSSTVWVINHNLGFEPDIELIDSTGNQFVAAIFHNNNNKATVTLTTAKAGTARCD